MIIRRGVAFLFVVLLANSASAGTTTYECSYPRYSDKEGTHKADEKFAKSFVVDHSTDKAYVLGALGSRDVTLIQNSGGLSYVEITDTGNVMVTAIAENGESVHSRTGMILGQIVPSQYYGHCERK